MKKLVKHTNIKTDGALFVKLATMPNRARRPRGIPLY